MTELRNKKVLVVGLGKSGVSSVRYLVKAGAIVTAADVKKESELTGALDALKGLPVKFLFGGHDLEIADGMEMIVASPGVPLNLPFIVAAKNKGIAVIGELELASHALNKPIVAVTGTNGKTTTTALIGHLLKESGFRICVAGNIGTPLLDVLDEAMNSEIVVLEVSSFQIETSPSLAPYVAVLLNITPDHLDHHTTFEEYVDLKARLLKQVPKNGFGIYNVADDGVSRSVVTANCKLIPFDATGKIFGRGIKKGSAWFGGGDLIVNIGDVSPNKYSLANVKLEGVHNRENMLAAIASAELFGAEPESIAKALETFKGLPHRVELVGEHLGVRYYDDSKGTNIGATIRALESFAEPVVLIAGGLSKGVDFEPLSKYVKAHVKKLVLIGEAAGLLKKTLGSLTDTVDAGSMEEAVRLAALSAAPGDVVLLSPACASFDMFRDYADRGNAFGAAVKKIISGR